MPEGSLLLRYILREKGRGCFGVSRKPGCFSFEAYIENGEMMRLFP